MKTHIQKPYRNTFTNRYTNTYTNTYSNTYTNIYTNSYTNTEAHYSARELWGGGDLRKSYFFQQNHGDEIFSVSFYLYTCIRLQR